MNSQILFRKHSALAALLIVISSSTVLAQMNQGQVTVVQFKGGIYTRSGPGAVVLNGILQGSGGGSGTASYIGAFTYTEKFTIDLVTGLSSGSCQIIAANGDVIKASSVGRALPDGVPVGSHLIQLLTITGGTGRFQGASGGFTMDRFLDDSNVPAFDLGFGTFTGTISTPGSNK
jgi:hypothetical protein